MWGRGGAAAVGWGWGGGGVVHIKIGARAHPSGSRQRRPKPAAPHSRSHRSHGHCTGAAEGGARHKPPLPSQPASRQGSRFHRTALSRIWVTLSPRVQPRARVTTRFVGSTPLMRFVIGSRTGASAQKPNPCTRQPAPSWNESKQRRSMMSVTTSR